jgi:hypothetical protein
MVMSGKGELVGIVAESITYKIERVGSRQSQEEFPSCSGDIETHCVDVLCLGYLAGNLGPCRLAASCRSDVRPAALSKLSQKLRSQNKSP